MQNCVLLYHLLSPTATVEHEYVISTIATTEHFKIFFCRIIELNIFYHERMKTPKLMEFFMEF